MFDAPQLDARLLAAAELVKPGLPAADIGCDHGKLAAWLVCTGHCPRVIACDLREGPLATAARTCQEFHCEDRVELRLGSGLSVVKPGEADTLVLAGISAQTTIEILEAASWVKTPGLRLVCVPATKAGLLRQWLWQQGFELKTERLAQAAGRWYTAICAEYTGREQQPSDLDCVVGLTRSQPGSEAYLAEVEKRLCKFRLGAAKDPALLARLDLLLEQMHG